MYFELLKESERVYRHFHVLHSTWSNCVTWTRPSFRGRHSSTCMYQFKRTKQLRGGTIGGWGNFNFTGWYFPPTLFKWGKINDKGMGERNLNEGRTTSFTRGPHPTDWSSRQRTPSRERVKDWDMWGSFHFSSSTIVHESLLVRKSKQVSGQPTQPTQRNASTITKRILVDTEKEVDNQKNCVVGRTKVKLEVLSFVWHNVTKGDTRWL